MSEKCEEFTVRGGEQKGEQVRRDDRGDDGPGEPDVKGRICHIKALDVIGINQGMSPMDRVSIRAAVS